MAVVTRRRSSGLQANGFTRSGALADNLSLYAHDRTSRSRHSRLSSIDISAALRTSFIKQPVMPSVAQNIPTPEKSSHQRTICQSCVVKIGMANSNVRELTSGWKMNCSGPSLWRFRRRWLQLAMPAFLPAYAGRSLCRLDSRHSRLRGGSTDLGILGRPSFSCAYALHGTRLTYHTIPQNQKNFLIL